MTFVLSAMELTFKRSKMQTSSLTPLKIGYYKFLSVQGHKAEAEFKAKLTANLKTVFMVDTAPLFGIRSTRPKVNTLYRKLIRVNSITFTEGEVDSCDWEVVTLAQLDILKAKELMSTVPTRIDTSVLTMVEALKLYDQIKANPENTLPDAIEEQYSSDDIESDDYEMSNETDSETGTDH